jgi:PknH-like extracellular domain
MEPRHGARQGIAAVTLVGLVLSAAACGQSGSGTSSTTEPSPSVGPVAKGKIDSLLLSDAELKAIGIDYTRQPAESKVPEWGRIDQSDPCQRLEWVSQLASFSTFRFVNSSGPENFGIHQAVAIYPDPQAASAVVNKYSEDATACRKKGGLEVFTTMTPTELAWSFPTRDEAGAYVGDIAAWNVRAVKNVVVDVQSLRRQDGVATAANITDQIVAKVNSAA